jgi:two-component system, cell cycle sensor histidine kinase and response regulator CckA
MRWTDPTAGQDRESAANWRGEGTVLVVDDEPAIRQVTQCMLECMGFAVLTAGDGDQGLELLAAHPGKVRAVLLDQSMPGLSGQEIMVRLRRLCPEVKIILASGKGHGNLSDLDGQDAPAFLQKPFDYDALAAKLKAVLAA